MKHLFAQLLTYVTIVIFSVSCGESKDEPGPGNESNKCLVTTATNESGAVDTYHYESGVLKRMTSSAFPGQTVFEYQYDNSGKLIKVVGLSGDTNIKYSGDKIVRIENPGSSTGYEYSGDKLTKIQFYSGGGESTTESSFLTVEYAADNINIAKTIQYNNSDPTKVIGGRTYTYGDNLSIQQRFPEAVAKMSRLSTFFQKNNPLKSVPNNGLGLQTTYDYKFDEQGLATEVTTTFGSSSTIRYKYKCD